MLKEAGQKFKAIVEAISSHLYILDQDLNIIWLNNNAKNFIGKNNGNITGRKCHEIFNNKKYPCDNCHTLKTFQDGKIHGHDTQMTDSNNRKKFFRCHSTLISNGKEAKSSKFAT